MPFFLQNLFFAILMLIGQNLVQRRGIGKMRFFRYSLAVTKELIKLLIFFNWAPRNAAGAPNFLFKEGSQNIFLSSSLAKPSIAIPGQPF